jgi:predicted aconitase
MKEYRAARERFTRIKENSGKAHRYVPNLCSARSIMATTEECVEAALKE